MIPGEFHPVFVAQTVFCLPPQSVITSDFGVGQVELLLVVVLVFVGQTGQTDRVIQWTDDSVLPEIQRDWVEVDISRQQESGRDMRANLLLLTLYLAIQCHMLSFVKLTSSQHKELKVGKWEYVAK